MVHQNNYNGSTKTLALNGYNYNNNYGSTITLALDGYNNNNNGSTLALNG